MAFDYQKEKELELEKLDFFDEVKRIVHSRESGMSHPRKVRDINELIKKIDAKEEALDV